MQAQSNQRAQDIKYYEGLVNSWETGIGNTLDKLKAFTKYVPLSEFPKLFVKYELFKKVIGVHGAIIECGVHQGGGLLTWGMLSSIFEPINHIRKIVGFDSFEGFTSIHEKDKTVQNANLKVGGLAVDAEDDIRKSIELFDQFRPLGHIPKVQLVRGNAISTIPDFVKSTPHLVVAMLYLDFDVYEPTKVALQEFVPRMPKGSILVFDELYNDQWPGETQAVVDTIGIQQLKLERFPFHPQISFAVL